MPSSTDRRVRVERRHRCGCDDLELAREYVAEHGLVHGHLRRDLHTDRVRDRLAGHGDDGQVVVRQLHDPGRPGLRGHGAGRADARRVGRSRCVDLSRRHARVDVVGREVRAGGVELVGESLVAANRGVVDEADPGTRRRRDRHLVRQLPRVGRTGEQRPPVHVAGDRRQVPADGAAHRVPGEGRVAGLTRIGAGGDRRSQVGLAEGGDAARHDVGAGDAVGQHVPDIEPARGEVVETRGGAAVREIDSVRDHRSLLHQFVVLVGQGGRERRDVDRRHTLGEQDRRRRHDPETDPIAIRTRLTGRVLGPHLHEVAGDQRHVAVGHVDDDALEHDLHHGAEIDEPIGAGDQRIIVAEVEHERPGRRERRRPRRFRLTRTLLAVGAIEPATYSTPAGRKSVTTGFRVRMEGSKSTRRRKQISSPSRNASLSKYSSRRDRRRVDVPGLGTRRARGHTSSVPGKEPLADRLAARHQRRTRAVLDAGDGAGLRCVGDRCGRRRAR